MHHLIGRRDTLKLGLSFAAITAIGGVNRASAQEARLRFMWWGGQDRATRTNAAAAAFEAKTPAVEVNGEFFDWGNYWPRVATQVSGGNAPDIMQMDYLYLTEYASRGVLLPLNDFIPSVLNLSSFDETSIAGGSLDGRLYGVNLGNNTAAQFYVAEIFERLGIEPPRPEMTWEKLRQTGQEVTQAMRASGSSDFWGLEDAGGVEPAYEVWLRQRGKALYEQDGRLGYTEADLTEWLTFWQEMRASEACVPSEVQALTSSGAETWALTRGNAAQAFGNSNNLNAVQSVNEAKIAMTMYPVAEQGGQPGQYLKPSQFLSVSATTQHPEEAVALVNFLVTDPEGVKLLEIERGIPASAEVREHISPQLEEEERMVLDYVAFVTDKVGALPPPPPQGAGEVLQLLIVANEQVGFGRMSANEAAQQHVALANSILDRN